MCTSVFAMLDVCSYVFVTFELTRCILAMLGLAMCTSGCTTSISLHTHSTCVLTRCVFGMLGVHGCAVAILDVRSCVLVVFELTRCVLAMLGVHGCANAMLDVRSCVFAILELTCVMLGVHGCVIAMCAGSCAKAISVCIRNI